MIWVRQKNTTLFRKSKDTNITFWHRERICSLLYNILQVCNDLPPLTQHIKDSDITNLSVTELILFSWRPIFLLELDCKGIELPKRTSSRPGAVVFIDNPKGHKSLVNRHRNIASVHWWRDIDLNRMINDHPRLLRLRITHLGILRILFTWQRSAIINLAIRQWQVPVTLTFNFIKSSFCFCGKAPFVSFADYANLSRYD